jgi:hypothetical protein
MLLEPGPVAGLEIPDLGLGPAEPPLAWELELATGGLTQMDAELSMQLAGLGRVLEAGAGEDLDGDLSRAGAELETLSFLVRTDLPGQLAQDADRADQLLAEAGNLTPPEAVTPDRAPYQGGPEIPEPAPYEPPPEYQPPPYQPYVPPPAAPVLPPSARLENLTGPVDTIFYPGHSFRLVITGPAYQTVSVQTWLNGVRLADVNYGQTGADGRWELTGFFTEEHRGAWVEVWYVGLTRIAPDLFFVCV